MLTQMDDVLFAELEHQWLRDKLAPRVEMGATWLDSEVPDWFEKIDLSYLQMSSASSCIAGQVFMNNLEGLDGYDWLADEDPTMISYGFYLLSEDVTEEQVEEDNYLHDELHRYLYGAFPYADVKSHIGYEVLAELWIEQIKARYDKGFAL